MTALTAGRRPAAWPKALPLQSASFWPSMALVLVMGLQLHLVFTRSINWDEFHFLALVYDQARGELAIPLQSFHTRLFAWLPGLDLPGVDQIVRGRIVMWLCEIASCASIALIARRFVKLDKALCCALAYASAVYVMQHGFAFRYDPLAAALSMTSLAILTCSRLKPLALIAFAVLMGTAFMVTIKIVLLVLAFAGIAYLRWSEAAFSLERLLRLTSAPLLAAAAAGLLYWWHGASLEVERGAGAILDRSGNAMFGFFLTEKLGYYGQAMLGALPMLGALCVLAYRLTRTESFSTAERLALFGLAVPVFWPLFYANTYPYFYAFMLAPVAAGIAGGIGPIVDRYGSGKFAILCAALAATAWISDGPSRLDTQRSIQTGVSEMFDEPVNYFDFPAFLPDHRKANFFMTNWNFVDYANANEPAIRNTLQDVTVPLLLTVEEEANPTLYAVMMGLPQSRMFPAEDVRVLRETYRHVWGPAWVAGTSLSIGEERSWSVHVPGTYTVEGTLSVNGQNFADGALITLDRGTVMLQGDTNQASGLLWGDHIEAPSMPPPHRPYWTGF